MRLTHEAEGRYRARTDPLFAPHAGTFSLWCHPKFEDRCHSVVEFIERAIMHSKNGKFLYFLRSRVPGTARPGPARVSYSSVRLP